MSMLSKITLAFALAVAFLATLPLSVGSSLAQATVPQGACTTSYYGTGPC
jgi:hypothetical protein